MPKPPRTELLPSPIGSYAKPKRGPKLPYGVGTPPAGSPTNKRCKPGSDAGRIRPFACSGKPDPKITLPLYGSPVVSSEPSARLTAGALPGSNRHGWNVLKLPSAL